MSHSKTGTTESVDRRDFLKTGVAAVVGTAAAGSTVSAADKSPDKPAPIATRPFGKTGRRLPILGFGGAALPKAWGNSLSTDERVQLVRYAYDQGIRYFDTAGNYMESESLLGKALKSIRDDAFLVTKVETTDPDKVRGAVENSLRELQTDYLDAILIHGTPGLEQMSVEQAMKVHAELVKLRDERVTRFIGFSAHSYFDKALALINSGGFDLCMLSYGYLPRGYNQLFSPRMVELRNACLARAHEQGMGIAAMKVVGGGVLGAWSKFVVPGFDETRLQQLPAAAIRFVLDDERIQLLVIGMRFKKEINANVNTFAADVAYTTKDRALLTEYCARAYDSEAIKRMKIE